MSTTFEETALDIEGAEDGNKRRHLISLSLTKTADALIDPKLILSWLITALGAPAYLAGAVVPIRESGALLPQPIIARWASHHSLRKIFWSLGASIQGAAAFAIGLIAFTFSGALAGWLILAALVVFSLGRAIASTTYKDALARTVEKDRRGTVTGWAGTIAATTGLAFGAGMASGVFGDLSVEVVGCAILAAAALFWLATMVFLRLNEDPQDAEQDTPSTLSDFFQPVREDRNFRRFVLARAWLTVTAIAPPFIVLTASNAQENSLTTLGPLVVASGMAAILSASLWGNLSDRSSRISLAAGGVIAATAYMLTVLLLLGSDGGMSTLVAAALLFGAQVGYQGVRSGRSIYLTNMASDDSRLRYTALSNILIGVVLLAGMSLGGVAHVFGAEAALAICAIGSICGALTAWSLEEV